ncbi:YbbR-like domain-containing protein [Persephonella sp.]
MEKIKGIFLNNLPLKILSLLVAFLLWLNITSTQKARVEFYSDVEIKPYPKDLIIEQIQPEKVLIIIEGPKNALSNVNISQIQTYVDGFKLKEGENLLPVEISKDLIKNFKIISIYPDRVLVYAKKRK